MLSDFVVADTTRVVCRHQVKQQRLPSIRIIVKRQIFGWAASVDVERNLPATRKVTKSSLAQRSCHA
jgi:hypothetical protein